MRIPAAPVLAPRSVHTGPAMITGQPMREVVTVRDPHTTALLDTKGNVRTMEAIETDVLKFAIRHHRGQMTDVARRLGIGRSTLYRKLKELGLDDSAAGMPSEGGDGKPEAACQKAHLSSSYLCHLSAA